MQIYFLFRVIFKEIFMWKLKYKSFLYSSVFDYFITLPISFLNTIKLYYKDQRIYGYNEQIKAQLLVPNTT